MKIVIPATREHKPVVEISIRRLIASMPSASILIVCPTPDAFSNIKNDNVHIDSDGKFELVGREDIRAALSTAKRHMTGWYYQQFLKYSIISNLHEPYVFMLDADTVMLHSILDEPHVFFTSKERHRAYYEHFQYLFHETPPFKASAITNSMLFDVSALRTMLSEIEEIHKDKWWKVIIDISNHIDADTAFSEYETYANWFSLRNGNHSEVPVHIYRRGDLLVRTEYDYSQVVAMVESKGYDAVAFELNHKKGLIRQLGARLTLAFGAKLW